jgi:large subunit ribosomal protein L6
LPAGVEFSITPNNLVTVKGPKGTLSQLVDTDITVSVTEGEILVERPTDQKRHRAMHGLYRSLISNMIVGVNEGYKLTLELVGVGFKASVANNNVLELALGYSHAIVFALPQEVKASALTEKGKNPIVTLESNDKQLVGQVAAKLRDLRPVEPYKGKGVRFVGEVVRRKAGKTSAK